MNKNVAIGLAFFVAANLLVTLAYGLLWPHLYDWEIIAWDGEARFLIELAFHGALAAVISFPFCIWFARQMSKSSSVRGEQ